MTNPITGLTVNYREITETPWDHIPWGAQVDVLPVRGGADVPAEVTIAVWLIEKDASDRRLYIKGGITYGQPSRGGVQAAPNERLDVPSQPDTPEGFEALKNHVLHLASMAIEQSLPRPETPTMTPVPPSERLADGS
jgi:hypothetical protein